MFFSEHSVVLRRCTVLAVCLSMRCVIDLINYYLSIYSDNSSKSASEIMRESFVRLTFLAEYSSVSGRTGADVETGTSAAVDAWNATLPYIVTSQTTVYIPAVQPSADEVNNQ